MGDDPNRIRTLLLWAGMILVFLFLFQVFGGGSGPRGMTFSEFKAAVEADKIKSVLVDFNNAGVTGELRAGGKYKTNKESAFNLTKFITVTHQDKKIIFEVKEESFNWSVILVSLLPMILIIGVIVFFMKSMAGQGQKNMNFGKARIHKLHRQDTKTFADVAGIDEVLEDAREIVNFFKDRKQVDRLGGRIPKGVLLMGAPGTGKTLLARAIAGEAKVPFLPISGSDFVEMFVGVGASRVRSLFEQAKKQAPCIIFIDELDAMGRQRGAGFGGGNDEREQTLNEILVQMDGFEQNAGVIVIAASNRPDILDAALTRAGRFDRKIIIPPPDVRGREAILQVHARGKKFSESVDFKIIARETRGMTGADLENIVNEAALVAVRNKKLSIEMDDIESAIEIVIIGKQRSLKTIKEELNVVAVHEAGHAIVYLASQEFDELRKVSIVPRGGALGVTWHLPVEDRHLLGKRRAENSILGLLGGRAAEEILLGKENITSGAANDLERVTRIIRQMVAEYGMDDEFGLVSFGSGGNPFLGREMALHSGISQGMQERIEERMRVLVAGYYEKVKNLLGERVADLQKLSAALLEKETLSVDEVRKLLE